MPNKQAPVKEMNRFLIKISSFILDGLAEGQNFERVGVGSFGLYPENRLIGPPVRS
jgi:hypothetical protein